MQNLFTNGNGKGECTTLFLEVIYFFIYIEFNDSILSKPVRGITLNVLIDTEVKLLQENVTEKFILEGYRDLCCAEFQVLPSCYFFYFFLS